MHDAQRKTHRMDANIHIRQATSDDAAEIALVKQLTWPDEEVDAAHIALAIDDARHATHVAVYETMIVGFVDGFTTQCHPSCLRWEVDLLAVHPNYRGLRAGERLVQISTQTGYQRGASFARGLIRMNNTASQRTFTRCSYRQDPQEQTLYIAPPTHQQTAVYTFARAWTSIPVTTLTYTGWWLEVSKKDVEPPFPDLEHKVVGIVLASEDSNNRHAAQEAGFIPMGQFHWWYHRRKKYAEEDR